MEPWEEALDVDDDVSELPSFSLRPCNHSSSPSLNPLPKPSSPSPALIPGPAGAVQAAMHRRSQTSSSSSDEPIPTQEFIRRVFENGDEEDDDFAADSWLHALDSEGGGGPRTPLGSIKKGLGTHRVAKVVAMIKSCTPNGLGDLMLTLKDPTGTIDATIHRKALSEGEFGTSISVGAVLVLQKVAVFSPSHSACYLNVTVSNIVKVISKDSGPLATKDFPISSVNTPALICAENSKMLRMPQEKLLPSQDSTQRIMKCLRQNSKVIGSENIEKHMETGHAAPGRIFSAHVHSGSQFAAVEIEPSLVEKAMPNGITKMSVREDIIDTEQVTGVAEELRMAEEDNSSSIIQPISGSANSTEILDNHGRITGAKRPRQPLSLTTALPDYTEEQLNLFDFD
ncbi:hypothetical protein RchiOBHm_Chr7g0178441 [Rosa chinensis]|uniref:Homologous recombination OB-fold protein OB-fold domain-containing protein n=1 Tax=Rosa chinensis TaxID=74649 RepID=A0A2P6P1V4_ROSCH|nr:homologous recombination OB-fold protein isoform X1 [Rosa chinensis]PRQ15901.1 hypothetical protein RchiOBHm_Chr7g0178441 [Rosa chinensis]